MNVISLKEYAAKSNVTYEAVRQQVVRYANELGDHVIRDGKKQFLDEEAVAFLDEKRQKNPVSIIQMDKDEEIERLKQENKNLLIKVAAQADKISEMAEWKADKSLLIVQSEQQVLLLEETRQTLDVAIKEKAAVEADFKRMQEELSKVKEELENEKQKTWFQKLLKK